MIRQFFMSCKVPRRGESILPGFSKDRKFVFQLGIGVFRPAVTSGVFPRAKKIKNMDDIKNLVFSPLEYDVHPFEWVAALVAEYKTLREKAIAAGVEMTDDPGAEYQMLREVSRFCEKASTLNKNYQYSHVPNYPADLAALIAFADAVVKNRKYSGSIETSTDPKVLFQRWKTVVAHKHGGAVECRVQYLPEGGGEIEGARFFAYNNIDGEAWQSVDVKLVVNEAERDDRPVRNYAGVRRLLGLNIP